MVLYTKNKLTKRETEKAISFPIAPKFIILRNKFTKKVKDLYTENHKTLMKETEEDTSKWKELMFLDWKN